MFTIGMLGATAACLAESVLWAYAVKHFAQIGDLEASNAAQVGSLALLFFGTTIGAGTINVGFFADFDGELAGEKAAQLVTKIPDWARGNIGAFEHFVDKTSRRGPDDPGDNYWPYAEHKPEESGFE